MAVVESIKLCHSFQAPLEVDAAGINNSVTAYASGLPLEPRPELLGYNSGLLCIIIAMMLIVIFNIHQYSRFMKTLFNDMWSMRRRSTLFDERTVNETRIIGALIVQLCVCRWIVPPWWPARLSVSQSGIIFFRWPPIRSSVTFLPNLSRPTSCLEVLIHRRPFLVSVCCFRLWPYSSIRPRP